MILGQLKIGERQANFGGMLTIASASPPPTTNADQNDQLKLFIFSGWVPSSLIQCRPSMSICTGTAFGMWSNQLHFILSENMLFDLQIKWCTNQAAALKGQSFRVSVLKWDHWPIMRKKSTTPKFCRYFSSPPLHSECRGKKGDQPLWKTNIQLTTSVIYNRNQKRQKHGTNLKISRRSSIWNQRSLRYRFMLFVMPLLCITYT